MKRLIIVFFAALTLLSCNKSEVDSLLGGSPEERISDSISKLKMALLSSENGWIGVLNTTAGGGFGFYINFKADETVDMLMDGNNYLLDQDIPFLSEVKTSTYRIKHVMTTSLLFDTYNYITLLQDPVPSVADGAAGKGLSSDIEFEVVRTSSDEVVFRGKKYGNSLTLYKATSVQKAAYLDGNLEDLLSAWNTYFDPVVANYVTIPLNGQERKVQLAFNISTKKMDLITLDEATETLQYISKSYAYTVNGTEIIDTEDFLGYTFERVTLENNTYFMYDSKGNKYPVQRSTDQIISLKYSIGESITELVLPGKYNFASRLPLASWSQSYVTAWNSWNTQSLTGGYNLTLGNGFYTFDKVNSRIDVSMNIYQGTNGFAATLRYGYTFDQEGNIKFTSFTGINGNGNIIVPYMNNSIHVRMMSDTFKMGYAMDSYFGKLVKFTSIEHPDFYFTWIIN